MREWRFRTDEGAFELPDDIVLSWFQIKPSGHSVFVGVGTARQIRRRFARRYRRRPRRMAGK